MDFLANPGDDKCVQHGNRGQTTVFPHTARSTSSSKDADINIHAQEFKIDKYVENTSVTIPPCDTFKYFFTSDISIDIICLK